jgi:mannitol-1-phosphate/altronate dehydrogenase
VDDSGNAIDVRDPLSDKIRAIVDASSNDERVNALLTLNEIFGQDLPQSPLFVDAVNQAYQRIAQRGARQAVIETLNI